MDDLSPCAFCGSEAKLERFSKNGMMISCSKCPAQMKQKVLRFDLSWLEKSLRDSWNRRKKPAETERE